MNSTTKQNGTTGRRVARWVGGLGVLALLWTCVVIVDETEDVIVERLGRTARVFDRPEDRGLHFKLPWPISTARGFDRRIQLLDPRGREVFTRDKKNITIDAYVCWKIAESEGDADIPERPVVRFFRSLNSHDVAAARLTTRVQAALSDELGQIDLDQLLSVTASDAGPEGNVTSRLAAISENVRRRIDEAGELREQLGIDLVDVRIKRLNFPVGNQQAVFERMRSERQKIADGYRSAGLAESAVIRSQADRQAEEILARADADATRIRGAGEAEAMRVLNEAYARDPEFYTTLRTLESYKQIINERTTLVLSASSRLFQLLTEGPPEVDQSSGTPIPAVGVEPIGGEAAP